MKSKSIAIITTGRQDYGILRSTIIALSKDCRFRVLLWVGGMHLCRSYGRTIDVIRGDGVPIDAKIKTIGRRSSAPRELAAMVVRASQLMESKRPDSVLLLGDRYETLGAAVAATLCRVPIIHLYGGEETVGAIDNVMRHAITKMSHLHLVSHAAYAKRIVQMGEAREDVIVVGAGGLDNLMREDLPDRAALEAVLGVELKRPVVVVTVHPTTLGKAGVEEVRAVAAAMEAVNGTYIVTLPNSDSGAGAIRAFWGKWARKRQRVLVVESLGERVYCGLLKVADAVLGNSSSALVEAPAAGVPVVNVGDRQMGRLRPGVVRDVRPVARCIVSGLKWAMGPRARADAVSARQLFPSGPVGPRIVEALAAWRVPNPPRKMFCDWEGVGSTVSGVK